MEAFGNPTESSAHHMCVEEGRNTVNRLKITGLVAVLALALMASAAASASGSSFIANGDTMGANITGTGNASIYLPEAGTNECSVAGLQGELADTPEALTTSLSSTCERPLSMNGCKLIYHPGAEKSPGVFGGSFEIGPAGCGPITATMGLNCPVSIYPKTGLAATYENQGSGSTATVTVVAEATNVKYNAGGICASGTRETGQWHGSWTVKADRGSQVSLAVQSAKPVAVGLGSKAGSPVFEADSYPTNILTATSSTGEAQWNIPAEKEVITKCTTAQYSSSISAATSELTLGASYGGCKLAGLFPVKVQMNGCQYVLKLTSEFGGSDDIACPAGKVIELLTYASKAKEAEGVVMCKAEIGSQKVGTIAGNGSGLGLIALKTSMAGLKYTYTKSSKSCPERANGTYEDGTYSHEVKLAGTK